MHRTLLCLGRFIPWKKTPGSLWGGKQRKIPRLTNSRKEAYLDYLLISWQNHKYLQKPCLSEEIEASRAAKEREMEIQRENQFFYDRYAEQFNRRFETRRIEDIWSHLEKTKRFDV